MALHFALTAADKARLRSLGYEDYGEYLASTAWREVQRRYVDAGLPEMCALCGSSERLALHHRTYERVGEEDLADLIPLCGGCHSLVHVLYRRGDIAGFDAPDIEQLVNAERARQNQPILKARRGRVSDERIREMRRRATRRRTAALTDLEAKAEREGVDISAELEQIDQTLDVIRRSLGEPPEKPSVGGRVHQRGRKLPLHTAT